MKGLAIVIGKGKGRPMGEPDPESTGEEEEEESSEYLDMLAEILRVPEGDKADFAEALKGYMKECAE